MNHVLGYLRGQQVCIDHIHINFIVNNYYAGSGEQHLIHENENNKLVKFEATVSDSIFIHDDVVIF